MHVTQKNNMNKLKDYADDATITIKLKAESIKRIIEIYETHKRASGLRINSTKTEVYVVTESLTNGCLEITKEIGLKNTTDKVVRYLGHKFQPLVSENKDQLKSQHKTIAWTINKLQRSQSTTLAGRIVNATAMITSTLRFTLRGITIATADMKQISKIQSKVNRYINPYTKGDSKFGPIKSQGSGVISIMDIYTSTRMYFIRQLYRIEGKHTGR